MKVLLGVCGGVAAYKAAELTRELQRRGAQVQVVMTSGAERFVTPLTFAALSGRQVLSSLWEPGVSEKAVGASERAAGAEEKPGGDAEAFDIEHIRVAQEIDCVVIAPATANAIAKLAHGMADDLLSTICLATTAPVLLAPAMNVNMWWNRATQENIASLRGRGVRIVDPAAGQLACGMVGEGRLADPVEIADAVQEVIAAAQRRRRDLAGESILITAGGTREPIDAVRYIGNRSSGKMGLALAEAAWARGAEVIVISAAKIGGAKIGAAKIGAAKISAAKISAAKISAAGVRANVAWEEIRVDTAAEMQEAVLRCLPRASIAIMAAAVSDYRVVRPAAGKLKKQDGLTLELTRNEDILRRIVLERRPGALVIGFAAETERVVEEGRRKLREKGVDAMVANDVSQAGWGFDSDQNQGVFLTRDEEVVLPLSSKREMADRILDRVGAMRAGVVARGDGDNLAAEALLTGEDRAVPQ